LLDRYLPIFHFREIHSIQIVAPPERVYRAIQEVTMEEISLASLLLWVRTLPARLLGRRIDAFRGHLPLLHQAVGPGGGFVLLDESPGRELVIGTVGQFWKISGGTDRSISDQFLAFTDPRYARAVLGFRIEHAGPRASRLITETRVFAPTASVRRRFALYWLVIRPGSGLLRRVWLGAIKRRAERSAPTSR
jgi:hypothetical protein